MIFLYIFYAGLIYFIASLFLISALEDKLNPKKEE